jgi:hypothetical protein
MIPVSLNTYTAEAHASIPRDVVCEHCGQTYHYTMLARGEAKGYTVYGIAGGAAARAAQQDAAQRLRDDVRYGCNPVRCPNCRCLQRDMVAVYRRGRLRFLIPVAVVLPALGVLGGIVYANSGGYLQDRSAGGYAVFGLTCLLSLLMLLGRLLLNARVDPNRDRHRYYVRTGTPGRYADAGEDPIAASLQREASGGEA